MNQFLSRQLDRKHGPLPSILFAQLYSISRYKIMNAMTQRAAQTAVAARVAGEDISKGDFVTVLDQIYEYPSYLWNCSDSGLSANEPVRLRFIPHDAGQPFKVVSICLPFIYAKSSTGSLRTFDVRQSQFVRLSHESGRAVWKRLREKSKEKPS